MSKVIESIAKEIADQGKEQINAFGRFTIVTVEDQEGLRGHGLSRCSEEDSYNKETGYEIAKGRALRSLVNKRKGVRNRNWNLG